MRTEAFDGKALVESLRDRHGSRSAFKNGGKSIGVVSGWPAGSYAEKNAQNADIIGCVATTNRVDLEREVVLPDGGIFDYLARNAKVFADHSYDHAYLVGGIRMHKQGMPLAPWPSATNQRGWSMRVGVMRDYPFPTADAILKIAEQHGIGASIGFEALEGGKPDANEKRLYPGAEYIVRKWSCLEVSFTCLPCNVDCQSMMGTIDKSHAEASRRALSMIELPAMSIETVSKFLRLDMPRRPAMSLVGVT